MARIAIVGPGAIGGVIAAWLWTTGRHDIVLCCRRPLQELEVETPKGVIRLQPTVLTEPGQASPVDWVLVATKAYDAAGAATWLPRLAGHGAPVAILQNGVEHVERFAPYVALEQILPVMIECPAERSISTRIRQRGPAKMMVPDNVHGAGFAALFAGTEVEVGLTTDFKSVAWRKLCLNSAGIINALLSLPSGVMHEESIGQLAIELVRECAEVGRAEGAILKETVPQKVLQAYRNAPHDSVNSMLADRKAGRPMEIDARNGAIIRFGQKHGIKTPYNQMAVGLLEAMARLTLQNQA
jgi:2-dehydropantoate 2-reductase